MQTKQLGYTVVAPNPKTAIDIQLRKRKEVARLQRLLPRSWADAYEQREPLFLTAVASDLGLAVTFEGDTATFS